MIGGALAALSGALLVEFIGAWAPSGWLYPETFVFFTAVIVGGRGSVFGVAIGAALIGVGHPAGGAVHADRQRPDGAGRGRMDHHRRS